MWCEELKRVAILLLFGIRNSSYPFRKFSLSPIWETLLFGLPLGRFRDWC